MTSANIREYLPYIGFGIMMLLVQIIAVSLSPVMTTAGYTAFEDPDSLFNSIFFIAILLAFTALMLVLIRLKGRKVLIWIIAASIFLVFAYIFTALLYEFSSTLMTAACLILAALATVLLYKYPEWYVIDTLGILVCAGTASIFGISFGVLPVTLLLILLAVYDAISVYKTKHMLTLAENIIETKAPILVIVPKSRKYSYIKEKLNLSDDKTKRGAYIMGMGDLIMPTMLIVSASVYLNAPGFICGVSLPVILCAAGSLAGLTVLLKQVSKGEAQAGLPALNGGAILGLLFGCALSGSWDWLLNIL